MLWTVLQLRLYCPKWHFRLPAQQKRQRSWTSSAAGCGKPAYFSEKKPLFEVQTKTGLLHNTNGGSAITPIGEADLPTPGYDSSAPIGLNAAAKGVKARAFQGGNHWDLHKMLEVKSGSEVGISYRFCLRSEQS